MLCQYPIRDGYKLTLNWIKVAVKQWKRTIHGRDETAAPLVLYGKNT
jgi:hypothetical protein